MADDKGVKLLWADEVDDEHYDAAFEYLSLHWLPAEAGPAVATLREATFERFLPGDLLRAAGLKPWPLDDAPVRREIVRALRDGQLQPVLAMNMPQGIVIADGTHRLSLAYHLAPWRHAPVKLAPSSKQGWRGPTSG